MDLTKEAIEAIQQTAVRAAKAEIVSLPGDARNAYLVHGSERIPLVVPPNLRDHRTHSLEALIRFAGNLRDRAESDPETCPLRAVVWHNEESVTLVCDDADRRDAVTFRLTPSEQLATLQALEKSKAMVDQRTFVTVLRHKLGVDPVVVQQFRRLDWNLTNEGLGDVQHGRERMGKSIDAQVKGIDELPQEIDVEVPLYRETGERTRYKVACSIEIDAVNSRLGLWPRLGELEAVVERHQASIAERLEALGDESGVAVYYGKP